MRTATDRQAQPLLRRQQARGRQPVATKKITARRILCAAFILSFAAFYRQVRRAAIGGEREGEGQQRQRQEQRQQLEEVAAPVASAYFSGTTEEVGWRRSASSSNSTATTGASAGSAANTKKMAACLVVMDDGHWLVEWIAFHYHVLPLDELVVMRDPQSRTSPDKILDRWKGRITVRQWTDEQVIRPWILSKYRKGNITQARMHRYRQQFFYAKCMKHFHSRRDETYLLMTDSDEFVLPNPYYSPRNSISDGAAAQNGSIITSTVDLSEPGCIRSYLDQKQRQSDTDSTVCLHIPRIQMSTRIDATGHTSLGSSAASDLGLNASHLLTASWMYHSGREITTGHNLDGKNMVRLGGGARIDLPAKVANVHHVLPDHCPAKTAPKSSSSSLVERPGTETSDSLLSRSWLLVYHYPGTYEQYTYRDDPRNAIPGRPARNFDSWSRLGHPAVVKDETVIRWLDGFVRSVGFDEARRLLDGVGIVE